MRNGQNEAGRQNLHYTLLMWLVLSAAVFWLLYIADGVEVTEQSVAGDIQKELLETEPPEKGAMGNEETAGGEEPSEGLLSRTVVLDVAARSEETKAVVLQVAAFVKEGFAESDFRLLVVDSEDVSRNCFLEFVGEENADLYVRLSVDESGANPQEYGIAAYYNEWYYIPGFGNPQWADALVREVTVASSNRAKGIFPTEENAILRDLQIPGAELSIGNRYHEKEWTLLGQAEYQEKIAEGIVGAIRECLSGDE